MKLPITRIAARSCRLARYFFALLSFIALMSSHAPRAYAVTNTWTGQGASTNGNWSAATNWGGTAPNGADNIIFAGTTGLTNTNDLAVNGTANVNINLLFATGAGAFVLNGTNATASALILTGPGVLTNLSTNIQTINFGLTFQTATANINTASNSVILNGIIAGTNITKSGAATLFLNGANTNTGIVTNNAGAIRVGNNSGLGTTNSGTVIVSGAALELTTNNAGGNLSIGAESLSLAGTGISSGGALRNITGSNTYGGLITLTNATRINADAGTLLLTNTGTITGATFGLTFGGAGNITVASIISNTSGTLTKDGSGTLSLTASNRFTGGTTINAGTIAISNNGAFASNRVTFASNGTTVAALANLQVTNNYNLAANGTMDVGAFILTNTGIISNTGSLTKEGAGTMVLSGLNTYGGTTTVAGGTLQVTNLANAGSNSAIGTNGTIILTDGGVFSYAGASNSAMNRTIDLAGNGGFGVSNSTVAVTNSGVITNTGDFTKSGAGTLVLSASNSFSGTTTVSAGVLSLANTNALSASTLDHSSAGSVSFSNLTGANLGGLQGSTNLALTNASGSAVALNVGANNSNTTYSGILSGSGSLTKAGAGTMVLGAANTYTGGTTINAGTVAISNGSAFGSNTVTFASSGTRVLALANMQVTNNYNLAANGTMDVGAFILTNTGVISGAGSLTKAGAGTLTLSGSNTYAGQTTLSGGTTIVLGSISNSSNFFVGQTTSGNNLVVSNGGTVADATGIIGSSSSSSNNSVLVTGAGSLWTNSNALYVGSSGSGNHLAISNGGTLADATGIIGNSSTSSNNSVLVTGAGSLWTNRDLFVGYVGSDNSLTVADGGTVAANADGFIGYIGTSSNNSVLVTGAGSLWTNSGYLFVGYVGSDNSLTVADGGTVANTAGFIGAFSTSNSVLVTGAGSLWTNSGTLNVGSWEDYSGAAGGTLTVASGGTVAASSITIASQVASSGMLNIGRFGTNDAAGAVTAATIAFGSGSGEINFNQSDATTVSAAISGAGSLSQLGAGTTTLTGSNTYTGGTAINAGTLQIGNGGTTGSLDGAITNNASLIFNRSDSLTQSGAITGTGSLTKAGAGTMFLSASNSYTGGTWISGGTLTAGNLYAFGTGAVTVGLNTFLDMANYSIANTLNNNGGTILNIGTISGGDFTGGTNDLSGNNSTVAEVTGTATVNVSGSGTTISNVTGGTVNVEGASTTIQSYNGGDVAVGSGLIVAMNDGNSSGVISGNGGMTKNSAGTLTLGGVNTYTGATTVGGGLLLVNGSIASSPVTIQSGGMLGGSGTVGALTVQSGGTINPGNSIGELDAGSTALAGGGAFTLEVFDWLGSEGTGWDILAVNGDLTLNSTTNNQFTINLVSLQNTNTPGISTNWNAANSFTNRFISYTGSLLGASFSPDLFTVNTGGFQNPFTGTFSVANVAGGLALTYTPTAAAVPEPGTWAAAALLVGAAGYVRWRKRRIS